MEAGQASAGGPFVSGCAALGEAFGQGGRSARHAASAVSQHLHGSAGPTISAALDRYADWSDSMTKYTHTFGRMAGHHKNRFSQTQQDTPSTTDFANRHRELKNAIAVYNSRPTPGAAQAVSKAHQNVDALNNRTHVVATTYRTGEDPPRRRVRLRWCRSSNPAPRARRYTAVARAGRIATVYAAWQDQSAGSTPVRTAMTSSPATVATTWAPAWTRWAAQLAQEACPAWRGRCRK